MYLLNLFHMQIFYLQNLLNGLKTVVFLIALRIGPASTPLHNSSNRVKINECGTFRDRGTVPLGHTRIQLNLHNPAVASKFKAYQIPHRGLNIG